MSSVHTSPPLTPGRPFTPPASSPGARMLPTPPSFSSRRVRSQSISPASPNATLPTRSHAHPGGHTRSVSFSLDSEGTQPSENEDGPKLYRIPQKKIPQPLSDHDHIDVIHLKSSDPTRRTAPPRPLELSSRPVPPGPESVSPLPKSEPTSAHGSRFAHTAAARGLSISPTVAKGREAASGPPSARSIWSSGLNPAGTAATAGWISPALNSARSTGTAARQRGLTVAVLKDNKEMLIGDVPVTPGLSSAGLKSGGQLSAPLRSATIVEEREEELQSSRPDEPKRKEVILCRYYHTPGLTCTSRPCRFVHQLEGLLSPKSPSGYPLQSPPPNADPTGGTFAQAQMRAQAKALNIDELVENGAAPGETVVLASSDGGEVSGTVFLMSGGGKGPAGKSKAKYKTVPCKDYAEGHCPYGDYCSFIHDENIPVQPEQKPEADVWRALPRTVPAVNVDHSAMNQEDLSAFAPPPLLVGDDGELVPDAPPSATSSPDEPIGAQTLFQPKTTGRSSSWIKGPPLSLKKVTIVEPEHPETPSHLAPPVSAFSLYGTESDPATPWDPAVRSKLESVRESTSDYDRGNFTPLTPPETNQAFPSYPWGMPMSPKSSYNKDDPLSAMPGGLGVMWTPAGWAVQDAAMKHSLRAVEVKSKYDKAKAKGKSYYRTRPCRFFAEGHCPHGELCTYLHVEGPLEQHLEKDKPKLRTLPCKFFNSASGCTNGDDCSFLHTLVVPASAPLVDKPRPWRTKPCRHYQLGRCTLGDACHFAHVIDPSRKSIETAKPCRHWAKGRCDKGDSCRFQHEGSATGQGTQSTANRPGSSRLFRESSQSRSLSGSSSGGDLIDEHEQQMSEARLAMAFEEMRLRERRLLAAQESDGEDDDDLEIVTVDTSAAPSPAQSVSVRLGFRV